MKFAPGFEIPPNWLALLSLGPNPSTYWLYILVLGANIYWESRFKGPKTYVPSNFPFPDVLYSHVAVGLWSILNLFAHMGLSNGWFQYPNQLSHTFWSCLALWFVQHMHMNDLRNPEEAKKGIEDKPKPAQVETSKAIAKAPVSNPVPAVKLAASKPTVPDNSDVTEKVIEYVRQNGQAKTGGLIGVLGTPRRTVIRNLNKLIEEGKLIREGNGAGAVYRLNDNPKDDRFN